MNNDDDCGCPPPPAPGTFTFCDGDTTNNYWVEDGVCMLDTLRVDQVVYALERNPEARADLRRVTSDPELLKMADEVPTLPSKEEEDALQQTHNNDILPYYTVFRGNLGNI